MEAAVSRRSRNPEAVLDALAMQSLRQRQGAMTSSSFNVTSNIDELVHKFTIDDSIAECFASCEKIAKSGKFIKTSQKDKQSGVVSALRYYSKRSAAKNTSSLLHGPFTGPSKKLLGGEKKPKKCSSPGHMVVQNSRGMSIKMADKSSISMDTTRERSLKVDHDTRADGSQSMLDRFGVPLNRANMLFDEDVEISPELVSLKQNMAKNEESVDTFCSANADFVTCDVTLKFSAQSNNEIMNCLKQAITMDNAKQLKIILSHIQQNDHVISINDLVELTTMVARLGQDQCLLMFLRYMSSATHVTPRDMHTVARSACLEAVRTDHMVILQTLAAEGMSIWDDPKQCILQEAKTYGSISCYGYMLLLQILALTFGKNTGNASLNDVLRSVYKHCRSGDSDLKDIVSNVLQHSGGQIDENQTHPSQQKEDLNNNHQQTLEDEISATESKKQPSETPVELNDNTSSEDLNKRQTAAEDISRMISATFVNDDLGKNIDSISSVLQNTGCVPSGRLRNDVPETFDEPSSKILVNQCSEVIRSCNSRKSSQCVDVLRPSNRTKEGLEGRREGVGHRAPTDKAEDMATVVRKEHTNGGHTQSITTYTHSNTTENVHRKTDRSIKCDIPSNTVDKISYGTDLQSGSTRDSCSYVTDKMSNQTGEGLDKIYKNNYETVWQRKTTDRYRDDEVDKNICGLARNNDKTDKPQMKTNELLNYVSDKKHMNTSSPNESSVTRHDNRIEDDSEGRSNSRFLFRSSEEVVGATSVPGSTAAEFVVSNDRRVSDSTSIISVPGSTVAEFVVSKDRRVYDSTSIITEGDDFADSFSTNHSFPTISELDSTTSYISSNVSDDEDESSYYSDDDDDDCGNYNVLLNLQGEEFDTEQLSQQRLLKHLESARRQMYRNSDYVETVITSTGQRLTESGGYHAESTTIDKSIGSRDNSDSKINPYSKTGNIGYNTNDPNRSRTDQFTDSKHPPDSKGDAKNTRMDYLRERADASKHPNKDHFTVCRGNAAICMSEQFKNSKGDSRQTRLSQFADSKDKTRSGTVKFIDSKDDTVNSGPVQLEASGLMPLGSDPDADLERRTTFVDLGHIAWNCRPWYEVSDDDSLRHNRSNDSCSDDISL